MKSLMFSAVIFFFCLSHISVFAKDVIRVALTNLYSTPSYDAEIVSQAIYNTPLERIKKSGIWTLVKTDDGYKGWVNSDHIVKSKIAFSSRIAEVKNLFAYVYRKPESKCAAIAMIPLGGRVEIIKVLDEGWINVRLAGGESGWMREGDLKLDLKPLNMQEMLEFSRRLVGLPYMWAGTSTYGFDCSGLIQFLYRQMDIILPRDANAMVNWYRFVEVKKDDLAIGDIVFFGWHNVISHVAVYLGDDKLIQSTVHENPIVQISDLNDPYWQKIYITARRLDPDFYKRLAFKGEIKALPEALRRKMVLYTWRPQCPVTLEDLVLVTIFHWGFDEKVHEGSLIVHKKYAEEIINIFRELYQKRFLIEKIKPIEEYQGRDEDSMSDNNSSAFNCRVMSDFQNRYSMHSFGMAIDINPLVNPYVKEEEIRPLAGAKYLDRRAFHKGKVTKNSVVYEIFTKYGWSWGGDWPEKELKDFHHFEKREKGAK